MANNKAMNQVNDNKQLNRAPSKLPSLCGLKAFLLLRHWGAEMASYDDLQF